MIDYILGALLLGWIMGGDSIKSLMEDPPPRSWESKEHEEMMMICKTMCGEAPVLSYEPYSGKCSCGRK